MAKTAKQRGKGEGTLVLRGKTWFARWMVEGKVYTRTTDTRDRRMAEAMLTEFVAPFRLGDEEKILETVAARLGGVKSAIQKYKNEAPSIIIDEGWKAYIDQSNRPDSGDSTLRQYEFQYKAFAKWFNDNHPQTDKDKNPIRWELRHVTQDDADRYAGHLLKMISATTFNRHMNLLALVWKVLEKSARLTLNPWKSVGRKRFVVHSRRELTVEELCKVCEAAQGEMRLLLALGIYCGLRLGDAACLDWGNVDMVKGIISLVPMKTARRSQKRVTLPIHRTLFGLLAETSVKYRRGYVLPNTAMAYLKRRDAVCADVARLFSSVDIKTNAKTNTKSESDARAEGGELPSGKTSGKSKRASADCGFHSLRHTFVSLCAAGGVPQSVVQSLVGHGSPAMTQHYTHIGIETAQNAVALLPDVTHAKGLLEAANATEGEIEALQRTLERMTLAQLQKVAGTVKALIGKFKGGR